MDQPLSNVNNKVKIMILYDNNSRKTAIFFIDQDSMAWMKI